MKTFLGLIKARRSAYEYSEKRVPDRVLGEILEAGRWAPSAHNDQGWHFIVVRDKERIRALLRHCTYGRFHPNANVFVCLAVPPAFSDKPGLRSKGLAPYAEKHRFMSASLPLLCMALAAYDAGVGSSIVSFLGDAKKLVGLPPGWEMPVGLTLGYEVKGAFVPKRERKSLKDIVSFERFTGRKAHH